MSNRPKNKKKNKHKPKPKRGLQVSCPGCGREQAFNGPDAMYYCPSCGAQFDGDPNEGGDFYNDPTKRMEKQER